MFDAEGVKHERFVYIYSDFVSTMNFSRIFEPQRKTMQMQSKASVALFSEVYVLLE